MVATTERSQVMKTAAQMISEAMSQIETVTPAAAAEEMASGPRRDARRP